MPIYQLGDLVPVIPASCYIAPEATIIGQVTLGERVTVMSGAVIRGDNEPIVIGDDSNVQEGCVLHTDPGLPTTVGKGVTVGWGLVPFSEGVGALWNEGPGGGRVPGRGPGTLTAHPRSPPRPGRSRVPP